MNEGSATLKQPPGTSAEGNMTATHCGVAHVIKSRPPESRMKLPTSFPTTTTQVITSCVIMQSQGHHDVVYEDVSPKLTLSP